MPDERSRKWFAWGLVGAAALGFIVRVAYVAFVRADLEFGGDAFFYHAGANLLVDGHGFVQPFQFELGRSVQAADHPPLYLLFLAVPSALGMTSTLTHLLWSCMLGTATVAVVGLAGRAVAGARVGIIAAVITAIYPNVWAPDGALQAETAAMFATALIVLLAYRYLEQPSLRRLVVIGALCGAAALARSELILLVPVLVLPLALVTPEQARAQRLKWFGAALLAALVVVGPWVGYNLTRFKNPVFLSSQFEVLLAGANCDDTYHGSQLGYFSMDCPTVISRKEGFGPFVDQSVQGAAYREAALDYIFDHKGRVPVVVAARVGRIVGVFRPGQGITIDTKVDGRESEVAHAALVGFYILALLSIGGALVLRRRRITMFPLLAVLVTVLVTVMVTYANTRFRTPAEVVLAVLAAVAIDAAVTRVKLGRQRETTDERNDARATRV